MTRADRVEMATNALVRSTQEPLAAIGVDAVEVEDFRRDVIAGEGPFLDQCFTPEELDHCHGDIEKLATRFALKEATLKALGTGIRGLGLRDVMIATTATGEPRIELSDEARDVARARRLDSICCSATHEAGLALAVVAATSSVQPEEGQ